MTRSRTPSRRVAHRRRGPQLSVDPIACAAHGLCADLLPDVVGLDEWGYPVLEHGRSSGPLDAGQVRHARAAVSACPTLALRLDDRRDRS